MPLTKFERLFLLSENSYFKLHHFFNSSPRVWVHTSVDERNTQGEYRRLFHGLRKTPQKFYEYMRMSIDTFDYILDKVRDRIERQMTNWRSPVGPEERLVVTIRYLITGVSFKMLAASFRLGASTVSGIVKDTCKALWTELVDDHMPVCSVEQLQKVKSEFNSQCNFPNCIGAINEKYCRVRCPPNTDYYKQFFSVVLQAVGDADSQFLTIEVEEKELQNNGATFCSSALYKCLEGHQFNIPPDEKLDVNTEKLPNVLVGNESYPLKPYLLRPYDRRYSNLEQTVFNSRLSDAHRCVERAFEIMYSRWQVFSKDFETSVETAVAVIKCACILHNVIRDRDGINDLVYRSIIEQNRESDSNVTAKRNRNKASAKALHVQEAFKKYFVISSRVIEENF